MYIHIFVCDRSRFIAVGIDLLLARRQRGQSSCHVRGKIFLLSTTFRQSRGPTQSPTQSLPGFLSPGIKRQGREADYSLPISTEVNNSPCRVEYFLFSTSLQTGTGAHPAAYPVGTGDIVAGARS
jgi:hypothetical protein